MATSGCVRLHSSHFQALSVGTLKKWEIRSLDIKNAFLQADGFQREVFLRPPVRWDPSGKHRIWKLRAPAFGLNVAASAKGREALFAACRGFAGSRGSGVSGFGVRPLFIFGWTYTLNGHKIVELDCGIWEAPHSRPTAQAPRWISYCSCRATMPHQLFCHPDGPRWEHSARPDERNITQLWRFRVVR